MDKAKSLSKHLEKCLSSHAQHSSPSPMICK